MRFNNDVYHTDVYYILLNLLFEFTLDFVVNVFFFFFFFFVTRKIQNTIQIDIEMFCTIDMFGNVNEIGFQTFLFWVVICKRVLLAWKTVLGVYIVLNGGYGYTSKNALI